MSSDINSETSPKPRRNVVLIGMPGAGKTSIGKRAAEIMRRPFIDTDALIEEREGMTCAEIINTRGEDYFRRVEREVLEELPQKAGAVIAVGGGAPVYSAELIKRGNVVISLERDLSDIARHIGATRPLTATPDALRQKYEERRGIYHWCADIILRNGGDIESIAQTVADFAAPYLKASVLVLNGPNLNVLGTREPQIYGADTYADLEEYLYIAARSRRVALRCFQSNHEGEIIDEIHSAIGKYDALIINPGAFTHYSYAIHDALKAAALPAVEVHISNIHAREEFRRTSVTAPACLGQISGLGRYGYVAALEYLLNEVLK